MSIVRINGGSRVALVTYMVLMAAVLNLVACAGGAGLKTVQRTNADVSSRMVLNDSLIVPGDRVGRVFLGMTEEQLYERMGNPSNTHLLILNGVQVNVYQWDDLEVSVQPSNRQVVDIRVDGPRYATREGVSVGSYELEMKAKLGEAAWGPVPAYRDRNVFKYWFNSGLRVDVEEGKVVQMGVYRRA